MAVIKNNIENAFIITLVKNYIHKLRSDHTKYRTKRYPIATITTIMIMMIIIIIAIVIVIMITIMIKKI